MKNTFISLKLILIAFLFIYSSFNLFAQKGDVVFGDTIFLDEVSVEVTRSEKPLSELPQAVSRIDKKEINDFQLSQASEIINSHSGIWVLNPGAQMGTPIVRGFIGFRVVNLFDGVRANTARASASSGSSFNTIDGFSINKIEIIRGAASVLYGTDAIGGVISVKTEKEPTFTDKFKVGAKVKSRYATADNSYAIRPEITLSNSKWYLNAGLTRRKAHNVRVGGGEVLDPSYWEEFDYNGQLNYKIDDNNQLQLSYQDYNSPESKLYARPAATSKSKRQLAKFMYTGKSLGFLNNIKATAYYQHFNSEFFSVSNDYSLGFDGQACQNIQESIKITYLLHYHHDDLSGHALDNSTEDAHGILNNGAIAVLGEWKATQKLQFDLGVRGDIYNLTSEAPELSKLDPNIAAAIANGGFSIDALNVDQTNAAFTFSGSALYKLHKNLNLVANVGSGFRAPNYGDLCTSGEFFFGYNMPSGDGNLTPEKSMTYEIGLRPHGRNFTSNITYFYTSLTNFIDGRIGAFAGIDSITVPSPTGDVNKAVYVSTNIDENVYAQGVEAEWNYYFLDLSKVGSFNTYGSITWMDTRNIQTKEHLAREMPDNAKLGIRWDKNRYSNKFNVWAAFDAWHVTEFSDIASGMINDPAFLIDPQDRTSGYIGGITIKLPAFTLLNFQAGANWMVKDVKFDLGIAVKNITDEVYRIKDSRMNGVGRNFIMSLTLTY